MLNEIIINNIEFFIFVLFLTIFLTYKRKNLEIQGSFPLLYILLYKTQLGVKKMNNWSKNYSKTFKYLSYLSIAIGIFGVIASFIFMIYQLSFIINNNISTGGGLVLPLKTKNGLDSSVPVFYVPFWYWLIALFVLVIVHEFAHGVIARRWKIKIKSSGFAFLGLIIPILPAAFVEPDEKDLNKKPWWQKIAVFGAGSLSNFIFGILFILLFVFALNPLINTTHQIDTINFNFVMNQSDLNKYNITSAQIIAFNNIYNKEKILTKISNISNNQTINLTLAHNNHTESYTINTFSKKQNNNTKAYIGISDIDVKLKPKNNFSYLGNSVLYFQKLIFWCALLNIGIGIMNLLPLWITDGGQITKTLLEKYISKYSNMLYNIISFITLLLIFFTLKPGFLIKLFT